MYPTYSVAGTLLKITDVPASVTTPMSWAAVLLLYIIAPLVSAVKLDKESADIITWKPSPPLVAGLSIIVSPTLASPIDIKVKTVSALLLVIQRY